MSIQLQLQAEVETELRRKAAEGGLTVESFLCQIAEREAARPSNGAASNATEEDEARPWRGVLVLRRPRMLLPLSHEFAFGRLPKREPSPNMMWHRAGADDE